MLYLVTGLPGASKSLNTLKYIIENDDWSGREIYYNNVKLLMLDIDVCHSFSGWFYGVYLEQLKKSDSKLFEKVMKVVKRVHKAGDFALSTIHTEVKNTALALPDIMVLSLSLLRVELFEKQTMWALS